MSKEIIVDINIDGNKLKTFTSLQIKQAFNAHHHFELVIDHDALEETGVHTLQKSQEYIGKFMTACFGQHSSGDNAFKGIITEVGLDQGNGLWGSLVLKGYSPTYLMEGGKHYTSFYERKLSDMLSEASKGLASNDMEIVNRPQFTSPITYMCQYGESNFAFINRLSAEYGEFFYYDGLHLFFGKPSNQDSLDMVYGEQIERMHFAMRMAATNVQHYSYNSKDDQLLSAKLPKSVSGADSYTEKALDISSKMFPQTVSQPVDIRTPSKVELDSYAEGHMAKLAANTVMLSGEGDEPKLKLGNIMKVKVSQKGLGVGENEHGQYLVTSLHHHIAGTGTYTNSFEAIPAGNTVVSFEADKPLAENQVATVMDNADPDGLGRIRVQMLWQKAKGQQTDWIRVMSSDAGSSGQVGKNRGYVFIPEVGDQVMVGFRYNDPNRPFVLGSVFHGNIAEGGGQNNNLKAIKTRSGHTLEFDDTDGKESIIIKDKNGNIILLDTSGKNITITAPETISINAKNIIMKATESISMAAEKNISQTAGENISQSAGKDLSQIASGNIMESSNNRTEMVEKDYVRQAKKSDEFAQEVSISSAKEDMVLQSAKTVKINSGEKSNIF
jgi:type VI secretion system secreted protein VgrG